MRKEEIDLTNKSERANIAIDFVYKSDSFLYIMVVGSNLISEAAFPRQVTYPAAKSRKQVKLSGRDLESSESH